SADEGAHSALGVFDATDSRTAHDRRRLAAAVPWCRAAPRKRAAASRARRVERHRSHGADHTPGDRQRRHCQISRTEPDVMTALRLAGYLESPSHEVTMACEPTILRDVPLFALLDDDELRVLAAQVELKTFAARQRIYKIGDPAGQAYVLISGQVQVTTIDEDHQDVVFDQPASG